MASVKLRADVADDTGTPVETRLKEFYELRSAEEPESDPEASLRFDKALAAAALRPGERVLDIGAKRGGLDARIRAAGLDVAYTAVDLSEANVAAARAAGLDAVQADVTRELPFAAASYDCVFCLELLEHLTSPVTLLAEIARVLQADGRAVISVPSPYSWVEIARELFHLDDAEGHLNAFTIPVMRNLAALAGFRVERILGTSVRIPKTLRLISTDSILARSRIYVLRSAGVVTFAGRKMA